MSEEKNYCPEDCPGCTKRYNLIKKQVDEFSHNLKIKIKNNIISKDYKMYFEVEFCSFLKFVKISIGLKPKNNQSNEDLNFINKSALEVLKDFKLNLIKFQIL